MVILRLFSLPSVVLVLLISSAGNSSSAASAAASNVIVTSVPDPATLGQLVTISAAVTAGATGKVAFYDGVTVLGVSQIVGGTAALTTGLLPPGSRSLWAHYGGDANYAASDSPRVQLRVAALPAKSFGQAVSSNGHQYGSRYMAVADFNGDGKPDLVSSDYESVLVWLGTGNGGFQPPAIYAGNAAVATGDFNGDGIPDIATGNTSVPGVGILLGKGDGTFQAGASYNLSSSPGSLVVADFNGDGAADLAVVTANNIAVLLGNGNGAFQQSGSYFAGARPGVLAAGDFNGDGKTDLATVNADDGTVSILLGSGVGSFPAPLITQVDASSQFGSLVVEDFDADGRADIAISGSYTAVLLGKGDGTFQPFLKSPQNSSGIPLAGDCDGDGKPDLVLVSNAVGRAVGNGDGTFQAPPYWTQLNLNAYAAVIADFNGDGLMDVVVTGSYSVRFLPGVAPQSDMTMTMVTAGYFSRGLQSSYYLTVWNSGNQPTSAPVSITDTLPAGLTAASMSGTGWSCKLATLTCTRSDALAANTGYPTILLTVTVAPGAPASVTNTATVSGGGELNTGNNSATATSFVTTAVIPQLTSSPNPSMYGQPVTLTATVAGSTGTVTFYAGVAMLGTAMLSKGRATFTTALLPPGTTSVWAHYGGSTTGVPADSAPLQQVVNVAPASGFTAAAVYATGQNPLSVAAGDFNGDGKPDLVTANFSANNVTVFLGKGDGTFQQGVNYPAGYNPTAVAVGDVDGDGKADLAVISGAAGNAGIKVLLGWGDGTFQDATSQGGTGGTDITIADFNGDGRADLAMADSFDGIVSMLQGSTLYGRFYLGPGGNFALSGTPCGLAIGDFNGDGLADLAVVKSDLATVTIRLGQRLGLIGSTSLEYPATAHPSSIAVGDFNGDGKADLAVADSQSPTVVILLGNGDGSFQSPVGLPTLSAAVKLIAADFNGDGKVDLALSDGQGSVNVLSGNGNGTFQAAVAYAAGGGPAGLAAADFNGDGRTDLAVVDKNDNTVRVLLGMLPGPDLTIASKHTGSFVPSQSDAAYTLTVGNIGFGSVAGEVSVTDTLPPGLTARTISGAGWSCTLSPLGCSRSDTLAPGGQYPAIILAVNVAASAGSTLVNTAAVTGGGDNNALNNSAADPTRILLASSVSVAASPNPSVFGQPVTLTATVTGGTSGTVTFYDGAAVLGIAAISGGHAALATRVLSSGARALTAYYSGDSTHAGGYARVLSQTVTTVAANAFDTAAEYTVPNRPFGVVSADFNGDGHPDLATANFYGRNAAVLLNKGDGTFAPPLYQTVCPYPGNYCYPYSVVAGDLNGDSIPDLAVSWSMNRVVANSSIAVLLGNGDGTFQPAVNYNVAGATYLAIADINRDGIADLVATGLGKVAILLGNGDGTLQSPLYTAVSSYNVSGVAVGDLNGDGTADVVTAIIGTNQVAVFLGNGDGSLQAPVQYPVGNAPRWVTLGDINRDGKPDLVVANEYSNTLSIFLGKGDGTFHPATTVDTDLDPEGAAIEDFNGDGVPDLLVNTISTVELHVGNGDGSFQPRMSFAPGNVQFMTVSDFNGDGRLDVAVSLFASSVAVLPGIFSPPNLAIAKSHAGDFNQGQTGAVYSITVTNSGPGPTLGTVNVADSLPSGLTATAMGGTGWSCTVPTLTCTRADSLSAGGSYPAITLTVSVSATAPANVTNTATVSGGGGPGTAVASDPTVIIVVPAAPILTAPTDGATRVPLTASLTWTGGANATSYDVYLGTSSPPPFTANVTSSTYSPSGLVGGTTYYWKVVAKYGAGNASSAVSSFSTAPGGSQVLRFVPVPPCRIVDTRESQGRTGPFGPPSLVGYSPRDIPVLAAGCGIPSTAVAYSLNFTVVPKGFLGYLIAWPTGIPMPNVSTLNAYDGQVTANAAIVPAGTGGYISIQARDATDVIIDVNGYFGPPDPTPGYQFHPVTPCRVADTRAGQGKTGPFGPPSLAGYAPRDIPVVSSGCGIPSTAVAYSLNVTAIPKGFLGYLITWPAGSAMPNVSTLNAYDGQVTANAAIVPAGTGGAISVQARDATDLVIDINGYFGPPDAIPGYDYHPVTPCRVADTRAGQGKIGPFGPPALVGYTPRDITVLASGCGIPSTAAAYSMNFTVLPSGFLGYLITWPAGIAMPNVSTLNAYDGQVTANAAIVPAGTRGAISVQARDATEMIIDINGYFGP